MNIELYIDNKLCDLDKSDLSIRLKRQFFNPKELNGKDAQKSYGITLPSTGVNDEVFQYKNVEETSSKFSLYPDAKLYVDGVLILEGKFRLTEITSDGYKGNLGVPTALTAKDILGEMKMNELKEWIVNDWKGLESISEYNKIENPDFFFPLVLYGLLPKYYENQELLDKNLFDDKVRLSLDDLPPSFNCMQLLTRLFEAKNYTLTGSAISDPLLNKLYVSYKNPNDHQMKWATSGSFGMKGSWGNGGKLKDKNTAIEKIADTHINKGIEKNRNNDVDAGISVTNLFNSKNNHQYEEIAENTWIKGANNKFHIEVPASGLYKIDFKIGCFYPNFEATEPGYKARKCNLDETNHTSELHLVRNREQDLDSWTFNNKYEYDVINQYYDQENEGKEGEYPQDGCVHFVDPKHKPNFICGFAFGQMKNKYYNPHSSSLCNPLAISGGRSWNYPNTDFRAFSAVSSPSYVRGEKGNSSQTGRFVVDLKNSHTQTKRIAQNDKAKGQIQQVAWLEKGDKLELIDITDCENYEQHVQVGNHFYLYELQIAPFQENKNWIAINQNGSSDQAMDWADAPSFNTSKMDMRTFLPTQEKANDWIDNFCKAFNLQLSKLEGNSFSLELKNISFDKKTATIINLDNKAHVKQSNNQSLDLPMAYEFGFEVNGDEAGYALSALASPEGQADTGAGTFDTHSIDVSVVKQNSKFSYCWYKAIVLRNNGLNATIELPILSDYEAWKNQDDYEEMMEKRYMDKAQRFWFKQDTVNVDLGKYSQANSSSNRTVDLALVSNTYQKDGKKLILSYQNMPDSIAQRYFTLLTNEKEYTVVQCYLTPQEYDQLEKAYIKFNGDLYIVAEADGYDPNGQNQTKLKLIKKM